MLQAFVLFIHLRLGHAEPILAWTRAVQKAPLDELVAHYAQVFLKNSEESEEK